MPPEPRANPLLLGHETAEATLLDAVRSGRMHHAWLITGPDGGRKLPVRPAAGSQRAKRPIKTYVIGRMQLPGGFAHGDYVGGAWHACWV